MTGSGGRLVRDRTVSMSSIGSSLSGEDESPSTPKIMGGKSPERLSPIPSDRGVSHSERNGANGLKESRSQSSIEKGEEKQPTLMEPFGKRSSYVETG